MTSTTFDCIEAQAKEIARLRQKIADARRAGQKFVDHYPMGINPDCDEAASMMREELATPAEEAIPRQLVQRLADGCDLVLDNPSPNSDDWDWSVMRAALDELKPILKPS